VITEGNTFGQKKGRRSFGARSSRGKKKSIHANFPEGEGAPFPVRRKPPRKGGIERAANNGRRGRVSSGGGYREG